MSDSIVRNKLVRCVSILESWGCSSQQIKRLLGIRFPKTLEGILENTCSLTPAMDIRSDCIINIHDVIMESFADLPSLQQSFVNRRNDDPIFKNQPPIQFMTRGIKSLIKTSERLSELNNKRKENHV